MSAGESIGILDWGVGGLDTYRQLRAKSQEASFIYWSDTGVLPYGKMNAAELRTRVSHVLERLRQLGAGRVVVACNAASTALPFITSPVPVTGVIEHGIASVPPTLTGTLGILGGGRTIRSRLYQRGLERPDLRLIARIAQPLSGHIEAGTTQSPECQNALERIMAPLHHADALLLACTHYAALTEQLRSHADKALILDPVPRLVAWIGEHWTLPKGAAPDRFLTTGDPQAMQAAAARVWNLTLPLCERVAV